MIARRDLLMALRETVVTICGLVALFSPILLWSAWSPDVFFAVLAGGCAAILLAYVLIMSAPDDHF